MDFMTVYFGVIFFISGLCLGSFLNCAAYRIARGMDFIHGKSHCPACGAELVVADLIPVISYMASRGRCRHCGTKISARYPLTELLFAALCVGIYIVEVIPVFTGAQDVNSILWLRDIFFVACLFVISLVDIEIREIPDGALLMSAAVWAVSAWFIYGSVKDIAIHLGSGLLLGAIFLIVSLVMDRILKKESLGGGDIKLFAVVGLYLGLLPSLFAVMIASLSGFFAAKILKSESISFGPFIAVGTYFMLLWGERLSRWYLELLF